MKACARDREKGGASWLQVGLLTQLLPRCRSMRACVCAYVHVAGVCVYVCMYVCLHTCMYVCIWMCMCICICMHVYTCVYECVCTFVHRSWVSVSVPLRARWCHECARVFVCICMRVQVCVYIYKLVHFFAVSVACTVIQVFWALVHGQVCTWHRCSFSTNVHICEHTRCSLCTYVYMHICVYMHAYVYGYVYASMILLDTLRRRYWDFLPVHRCAYSCVCICVCMYACICVCVYVCICIYVCLCTSMHIHLYTRACGCTYALV